MNNFCSGCCSQDMALESSCRIWCWVILVRGQRFGKSRKYSYSMYTSYRRLGGLILCWIMQFGALLMISRPCCIIIWAVDLLGNPPYCNYWFLLYLLLCSCGANWKLYKWYCLFIKLARWGCTGLLFSCDTSSEFGYHASTNSWDVIQLSWLCTKLECTYSTQ